MSFELFLFAMRYGDIMSFTMALEKSSDAALHAIISPDLTVPLQHVPKFADRGVNSGFIYLMRRDGTMDHVAPFAIHKITNFRTCR